MPLQRIFSFLTHPKSDPRAREEIEGAAIPIDGEKVARMLGDIFDAELTKRDVPIKFTARDQVNAVRDAVIGFVDHASLRTATRLAQFLQDATPGTAGMGLFFVCVGTDPGKPGKRTMLSRFAADEGVIANRRADGVLSVEFVEQVFLKNAQTYKSATFRHERGAADAWKGLATDRQLNHGVRTIADYWIVEFLKAELTTSSAEGTRRLAVAMREASRHGDAQTRAEIVAAARLGANLPRVAMTIEQFCDQFALSPAAKQAVKGAVPPRLLGESFRFDAEEFAKHVPYKQVELDNGVVLAARTEDFDEVLRHRREGEVHTFATSGVIVDEKLRTSP